MKKSTSRLLSALLALCMVLALMPTAALAEPRVEGLGVASRTIEEIRAFIAEHPATLSDPITYKTEPSLSEPYSPGVLSDETETSALNMLNQVRFIAGLHADVTLDENYSYLVSAASLLNCLNNQMSHYPSRPDVLAGAAYDKLYSDGGTGARRGNLAYGYRNLNDTIIRGWCADDGQFEVGHRRWILNPTMGKTGFGAAGIHSTMYAHDTSGKGGEYNVAWPAQMMPVEYFSSEYPWSLSVGTSVNANDVSVKMVRRSDNKTWNFKKVDSEDVILFDDIFYVNNGGYGTPGNISFQTLFNPEVRNGAIYDITVTIGSREIRYSVSFFSLESDTVDTMYPVTGGSIFFDSKTGTVTGCDSSVTEAVIPSKIGGVPVTGIGNGAFWGCDSLTSVTIPASVTSIGRQAFYSLYSLTDIYYGGSESQWKLIKIDNTWNGNDSLLNATVHYNSPIPDTPDTPDTPDEPDIPDEPDTPDTPDTPSIPKTGTAHADTIKVEIDGKEVTFQAYALWDEDGFPTNYVKVRDLADAMNGTKGQFEVFWDPADGLVKLFSKQRYTPNGSEGWTPFSGDRDYTLPSDPTYVDGTVSNLVAFVLTEDDGGQFTYYQLRDLGRALGFNVGYDEGRRVIFIEPGKPYSDLD